MNQLDLPWGNSDAATRQAALAEMLVQVSLQASQGETLDDVLKHIVDCIIARMPIAIASIILLNHQCTHFVQEVYAGACANWHGSVQNVHGTATTLWHVMAARSS